MVDRCRSWVRAFGTACKFLATSSVILSMRERHLRRSCRPPRGADGQRAGSPPAKGSEPRLPRRHGSELVRGHDTSAVKVSVRPGLRGDDDRSAHERDGAAHEERPDPTVDDVFHGHRHSLQSGAVRVRESCGALTSSRAGRSCSRPSIRRISTSDGHALGTCRSFVDEHRSAFVTDVTIANLSWHVSLRSPYPWLRDSMGPKATTKPESAARMADPTATWWVPRWQVQIQAQPRPARPTPGRLLGLVPAACTRCGRASEAP